MANPVLSESRWDAIARDESTAGAAMTVNGTLTKTAILLATMLASLIWMWSAFWNEGHPHPAQFMPFMIGGAIAGLIAVVIASFARGLTMPLSFVYALAEGLLLGGITMLFEVRYPGLPMLAACLTSATLLGMLFLYRTGVITASPAFVRGVVGATAGLAIGLGLLWLLSFFGIGTGLRVLLYGNGPIGIGFSVICVALAALNLVLDFAFLERGAQQRLPKSMEWVGALGLLVTLVWLYVEILRLLGKLRGRD